MRTPAPQGRAHLSRIDDRERGLRLAVLRAAKELEDGADGRARFGEAGAVPEAPRVAVKLGGGGDALVAKSFKFRELRGDVHERVPVDGVGTARS